MYIHFPGIVNSCTETGEPCPNGVWAKNKDEARAGLGVCEKIARAENKKLEAKSKEVEYPELGTISDVKRAISNGTLDPKFALEAEKAGKQRATLIEELEVLANG